MKTWPDTDGDAIARYLRQLRLRCPISPIYYRQALRSFQEVVIRHQLSSTEVSRDVLEAWLRERALHWPVSTLLHRARIVNRFLDFLVQEGLITSNPIADLRAEYCVKKQQSDLASPARSRSRSGTRSATAVPALRQRPWRSDAQPYRADARPEDFDTRPSPLVLAVRSLSAGSSGACRASRYRSCCSIGQRRVQPPITPPNAKSCSRLGQGSTSSRSEHRVEDVRIRVQQQQVARQWRRPYIYSPEEVRRLLDIARTYPSPRAPLRPISFYTMLVLAYCAGLRMGELARLNLGDVDLQIGHDYHPGDEVLQIQRSCR